MSTKRSSRLIVNLLRLVLCTLTVTLILRVGQYADSRAFQSSAPLLAEGKKYSSPNTDWLTLQDVLNSVERTYPLLLGAEQERAIAEADWMSAQGAFDLSFRPKADLELTGKYTHHYYDFVAEQPTTFWGTSFFGGYRVGAGNYATYDGKLETWDNGEWRTGLRVPFLRNGPIDRRRANLRLASLGKELAGASVGLQRIAIFRAATRRYWEWVAAGRRLSITQSLLKIAEIRNQNLSEMVNLGQIAPIEFTDNARTILERKAQLVAAERGLQAAAIELSMYYRGPSGDPMMPEARQLPLDFPDAKPLTEDQLQTDLELALKRRPEIVRLQSQREQSKVEMKLAQNQKQPAFDVFFALSQDRGTPNPSIAQNEAEASFLLDIPLQRRAATGKFLAEKAKLERIDQQERFARDRVAADLRDAFSAIQAAYQRLRVAREELQVARQLEEGERNKFELGDSTIFIVNLREIATADAAAREVLALLDYHSSMADYEAAIAENMAPRRFSNLP